MSDSPGPSSRNGERKGSAPIAVPIVIVIVSVVAVVAVTAAAVTVGLIPLMLNDGKLFMRRSCVLD